MNVDARIVKELRDKTGAGMMDCKKALTESEGDIEKAIDYLRKTGIAKAEKKGSRVTKEGIIYSYIHAGGRLGVLIEVNCETDFVAKTDGFIELAHNLSMQIAATNPIALDRESIPASVISREKDIYVDQAKSSGKPENIIEKMVDGRIKKFYQENVLLEQTFVKDPSKTIKNLIAEKIGVLGENILIAGFSRYQIGEK